MSLEISLASCVTLCVCLLLSTGRFKFSKPLAAFHTLATMRWWLQMHNDDVDRIVLCAIGEDRAWYDALLPMFFPKDQADVDSTKQYAIAGTN